MSEFHIRLIDASAGMARIGRYPFPRNGSCLFKNPFSTPWTLLLIFIVSLFVSPVIYAMDCPPSEKRLVRKIPSVQELDNPNPIKTDFELPMPCGGKLILRHICVPAEGFFGDLRLDLGCENCGRDTQGFMEGKRKAEVSGPFTLQDLPGPWQNALVEQAKIGDGWCPNPNDENTTGFYYFIGKYEISNFQWNSVMHPICKNNGNQLTPEDARPKTGISWFEAIEFTRRYTEWLLKNSPDSIPRFPGGRFAYIRLPTEAEWEYAARGGHRVSESEMNESDFFPLHERKLSDYAVFTDPGSPKLPEKPARIGTKCPNPVGIYDIAGNAAEMVLDPFRFSLGFRLHGATGGFIAKGGSYRKRREEIMPGRREEQPFFLEDGAFRAGDLGFRVVLSGIVTPRNRFKDLGKEWVSAKVQENLKRPVLTPPQMENAVARWSDDLESEGIKTLIRSAIFTAGSVISYSMRRQVMLFELNRLQIMKTKIVPESVLEDLEKNILKAAEAIGLVDISIDAFAQFYMNKINESQKYPSDIFENQMAHMDRELSLEEGFSQSIKSRLDLFNLFKNHVDLLKTQPDELTIDRILTDLLPATGR